MYLVGGQRMPLRKSSFRFVHVQTIPSGFLWRRLKRKEQIKNLDDNCTNLYMENMRGRYARPPMDGIPFPPELEHLGVTSWEDSTLDQFASWFEYSKDLAASKTGYALLRCSNSSQQEYVTVRKKPAIVSCAFRSPAH